MMGDEHHLDKTGRTFADLALITLANRVIRSSLLAAIIGVVILSYFDLVNVQYDNGLKFRLGPNPAEMESKRKRIIEEADARSRADLYNSLSGKSWYGYVKENIDYLTSVEEGCSGSVNGKYNIEIGKYDPINNIGSIKLNADFVSGNFKFLNNTKSSTIDKDIENGKCLSLARLTYLGKQNWNWTFDGQFGVSDDKRQFIALLYQTYCETNCYRYLVTMEPLTDGPLVLRASSFFIGSNDPQLVITMQEPLNIPPPKLSRRS
jgi:hypothetical protein